MPLDTAPVDPIAELRRIGSMAAEANRKLLSGEAKTGTTALTQIRHAAEDAVRNVAEDAEQRRGHTPTWVRSAPCRDCGAGQGESCRRDCPTFGTRLAGVA